MRKNLKRFYISLGVVFAVFTVIAFTLPFARNSVFWIAYLFGVLSIGVQAYIMPHAFQQGSSVRSKFYGFPIARVGAMYIAAQIVLSLVFMALTKSTSEWVRRIEIILSTLLFGAAMIGVLSTDAIRNEVERQDVKLKKDVTRMRALQSKAASLRDQCDDAEAKATLGKLADAFRFSDPVSNEETVAIEDDLAIYLDELQSVLTEGDYSSVTMLCRKIISILSDRNQTCKNSKLY